MSETIFDAIIILVSLIVIAACVLVLAYAGWWVWSYVFTDDVQSSLSVSKWDFIICSKASSAQCLMRI
jgi:hypothetical protein